MKVAIIGSGNVGSAIARASKQADHEVTLADAASENLAAVGERLGVSTAASNAAAAGAADAVVIAVPFGAVKEVAADIADHVRDKVVIDVTNPLKDDFSGLVTEGGESAAELLQAQLPQAKVVKAFNTVLASNQDKGEVAGAQLDGFVAGDDADAKKQVLYLLEEIGFRPVDAGPLAAARYLEAMAFLNISLNAANGWSWQTGWKLVGPAS